MPHSSQSQFSSLNGWRLAIGVIALVWAASIFVILQRPGAAGLREAILLTARVGSILFLPAFIASSLARLWPSPWTLRLLAYRRYLGIAFGFVMILHYLLLVLYAQAAPVAFEAATPLSVILIGGTSSVLLVLMTATSFVWIRRRIGNQSWTLLHTAGAHAIWFTYLVAYYMHLKGGFSPPFEATLFLLLISALLFRLFGWAHALATHARGRGKSIANSEVI